MDRGGLFHVNDNCFKLFKSIELKTQKLLPKHLKGATEATKDQIIQNIVDDERVQLDWCYVAVDIADERDADELLKMIVENWVTIRGLALASKWIEDYKRAKNQTLKSLRDLKTLNGFPTEKH